MLYSNLGNGDQSYYTGINTGWGWGGHPGIHPLDFFCPPPEISTLTAIAWQVVQSGIISVV